MDGAIPTRSATSSVAGILSRIQSRQAVRARTPVLASFRRMAWAMAVTDAAAIGAGFVVASAVLFGLGVPGAAMVATAAAVPVWLLVFGGYRLYSVQHLATGEEFRRVLSAASVGGMLLVAASIAVPLPRAWIALAWALACGLVVASRAGWHRFVRDARLRGTLVRRTLVVGTNAEAERLAQAMSDQAGGFDLIGHIETASTLPGLDTPAVGELSELGEVARATGADCVFVAASAVRPEDMRAITKLGRRTGLDIRVSANLPDLPPGRVGVQAFGGLTTLSVRPVELSRPKAFLKRASDLTVASVAIAVTAPVWLAIAVAVKISSKGPVLYRQIRVGRGGRPFGVLKFRTMRNGAEEALAELRALNEASGPLFKIRDDPRVTGMGRLLRRWSLDELPQLLNVVRGEMSLVGPRPPLPEEVEAYEHDWHFDRLDVLPGITGLWQVSGRSNLSFDDYMRLDLNYVESWSLGLDLLILARTVPALLSRKGAW